MRENAETSLDHLDSERTITGSRPCGLLAATTHTSLNGHTLSGLVPEQLLGLLVWSYQPSVRDPLPNPEDPVVRSPLSHQALERKTQGDTCSQQPVGLCFKHFLFLLDWFSDQGLFMKILFCFKSHFYL